MSDLATFESMLDRAAVEHWRGIADCADDTLVVVCWHPGGTRVFFVFDKDGMLTSVVVEGEGR